MKAVQLNSAQQLINKHNTYLQLLSSLDNTNNPITITCAEQAVVITKQFSEELRRRLITEVSLAIENIRAELTAMGVEL